MLWWKVNKSGIKQCSSFLFDLITNPILFFDFSNKYLLLIQLKWIYNYRSIYMKQKLLTNVCLQEILWNFDILKQYTILNHNTCRPLFKSFYGYLKTITSLYFEANIFRFFFQTRSCKTHKYTHINMWLEKENLRPLPGCCLI
jgi:hypothetical protein